MRRSPFSAKIGSFPTKATREALAPVIDRIEQWMARVEEARAARLALAAMQKTRALHDFAQAFLPAYARAKQLRGWLDFDDLILRARDLLTDERVAAWVLYRLDGGIDHILVDEAQDTSPVQWQVIERLAQEFTAGQGARSDTARTIFVVGDKKQSIYSFQGADPREFDRMQRDFADRLSATGTPLQSRVLAWSFRSSRAILTCVDCCFDDSVESGLPPRNVTRPSSMRCPAGWICGPWWKSPRPKSRPHGISPSISAAPAIPRSCWRAVWPPRCARCSTGAR